MNSKAIFELNNVFMARLEEKNSWGKNEVKELWRNTLLEFLLREDTI